MIDLPNSRTISHSVHKTAPLDSCYIETVPEDAVLLSALKTLEYQLQDRGYLTTPTHPISPVWFTAETERNLFLWRIGCSLTQKDEFEFWVDIDRLIEKRLDQLTSPGASHNKGQSEVPTDKEAAYLYGFTKALPKLRTHAHALSHAGLLLELETLSDEQSDRQTVLLPG